MAKLKKQSPDAQDANDSATIDEVTSGAASHGNMAGRVKHGPRPMRLMKDSKNSYSKTDTADHLQSSNLKDKIAPLVHRETP